MIRTETYMIREDGVALIRTYSDADVKIKQDGTGAIYDDAIDPENSGRSYTETNIPIEHPDDELAQAEDYEAALAKLGVEA